MKNFIYELFKARHVHPIFKTLKETNHWLAEDYENWSPVGIIAYGDGWFPEVHCPWNCNEHKIEFVPTKAVTQENAIGEKEERHDNIDIACRIRSATGRRFRNERPLLLSYTYENKPYHHLQFAYANLCPLYRGDEEFGYSDESRDCPVVYSTVCKCNSEGKRKTRWVSNKALSLMGRA